MRKTLLVLAALLITINIDAETHKNELIIQYGQFTVPQGIYLFGSVMGMAFSLGHLTMDNTIMTGTLSVEYNRNVNNWFGYGGLTSFEYMTSDTYITDSDGNRTKNGVINLGVFTLMPTAHLFWFRHPRFGMYSKLGAGVGLALNSDTSVLPSFQLSPVCMEFGGEKYKGVFELGFGTQGIAVLGIKRFF